MNALAVALALCLPATVATQSVLLTGGNILDVEQGRVLSDHSVLIVDGRIRTITDEGQEPPPGTNIIDLQGQTLLPGLIELHSHLLLHPYNEASWNDQVLREQLELRTIRAVVAARTTLRAGWTTLRELGTEGAGFADVALRDAIAQGLIPGPRLFAATKALVATGSYGPSGFDPRWTMPVGAQVADGPTGVRKAVREQIAAGANWIKVYADYRRTPGVTTPTFSQEELDAIVHEATSAGLQVAAHASTDEAIRRCIRAGVATIEHGYNASEETLRMMKAASIVLCPTLTASESTARYAGWRPGQPVPPRVRQARELLARALRSGVTIGCGSDVGVFSHGGSARELELMVEYGMDHAQALRSATTVAADVLRRPDLGRISEGATADLIAVRGNPLEDISVLRNPTLVIKDGKVVE